MSDTPAVVPSSKDFLQQLERLLAPGLSECYTEETKKLRNLVLIIGFVLILLALGVLSVRQESVKIPLLGLAVTVTRGLRWVLIALCTFFLVLFSARSYGEWHLWRLRNQAPLFELKELAANIRAAQIERARQQQSRLESLLNPSIVAESAADEGEIRRLRDEARAESFRPEDEQLLTMQHVILEALQPVRRTLSVRLWLEAFFPIVFGILSILWAALAPESATLSPV